VLSEALGCRGPFVCYLQAARVVAAAEVLARTDLIRVCAVGRGAGEKGENEGSERVGVGVDTSREAIPVSDLACLGMSAQAHQRRTAAAAIYRAAIGREYRAVTHGAGTGAGKKRKPDASQKCAAPALFSLPTGRSGRTPGSARSEVGIRVI
jgi:hypothetical protein